MSRCDKLTGTLTLGATMSGRLLVAKGDKGDKGDDYIITEADKQEIKESLSADISELKGELSEEKTQRETADSTLQRNIENEASSRGTADSALQRNIESEKSARETADNAINAALESHGTRLNNLEHYTIKVDSEGYIAVEYKG